MRTVNRNRHLGGVVWVIAVLFVWVAPLGAQSASTQTMAELWSELDRHHENDEHERVVERIDSEISRASEGRERAELYWRRARAELSISDLGRYTGAVSDERALDLLEEAERFADRAIAEDPTRAQPYFWKAAAIGQRGQIQGVLNSLFMAGNVRDAAVEALERNAELGEVHFLLGQLYRELPGRPLSFGNDAYAVSFGRRAVDLHEQRYNAEDLPYRYYDYYTQLASSLRNRNWNAARRRSQANNMRRDYSSARENFEKFSKYEGAVELSSETDRQEGKAILDWVIAELEREGQLTVRQQRSLEDARELAGERW